jgi:hypothetical protein
MPSLVVYFATASALIKTTLCSTTGAEGGAKGGAKNGAECGVKEVVADRAGGHARARCCEVSRRPLPLLIR